MRNRILDWAALAVFVAVAGLYTVAAFTFDPVNLPMLAVGLPLIIVLIVTEPSFGFVERWANPRGLDLKRAWKYRSRGRWAGIIWWTWYCRKAHKAALYLVKHQDYPPPDVPKRNSWRQAYKEATEIVNQLELG